MNQKHLWTVVAVVTTVMGMPSIGYTQTIEGKAPDSPNVASKEVVKVGEYQSSDKKPSAHATVSTKIHTHEVAGRQAATLYIRDIPVLTFIGQQPVATVKTKVGEIGNINDVQSRGFVADRSTKVASVGTGAGIKHQTLSVQTDPVSRASAVAARINQLIWSNVDASKITASWKANDKSTTANQPNRQTPRGRYIIQVKNEELVEVDSNTRLSDTTNDPAKDALQAANRLRRLIGNASPLKEVANSPERTSLSLPKVSLPNLPKPITVASVRRTLKGWASFYGYDGSGNRTATGERYNPEGLTAAHRSLPFGTRVRVTNTRNGRSVIVRINDRGPFIRGRIIDLSVGAARILGMIRNGVAPVRVEVLGR